MAGWLCSPSSLHIRTLSSEKTESRMETTEKTVKNKTCADKDSGNIFRTPFSTCHVGVYGRSTGVKLKRFRSNSGI